MNRFSERYNKLREQAEEYLRDHKRKFPNSTTEIAKLLHELNVQQIELELQNKELKESRAETEKALRLYNELYDSAIVGYFTFDHRGTILLTNLMGASFFNMEKSELIGKNFTHLIQDRTQRMIFENFLKKIFKTKTKQNCEIYIHRKDESFLILHIKAKYFNKSQECRAIARDITESVQSEKLIRQHGAELAQLMHGKSMGELASAIAHEINQPLTAIRNYVNGCINHLESDNFDVTQIVQIMQVVDEQVTLAGEIVHRIKNLARQNRTSYKLICINDIIKAAVSQIQKETHYDFCVSIELELVPNPPLFMGDNIQIELVILNLMRNALQAMQKFKVKNPKTILRTEYSQDAIVVSVINNGPHYTQKEEENMFKPHFTTKKTGMGLGLSISRTIVESHGGHLTSHKVPGAVCFRFSLPIKVVRKKIKKGA